MLLVHQTGAVKVGEVVRYTVTYTPTADRILPSPSHLHVKIKNTSAIPLRAAYLHGPYTLHVASYPSTFNPNRKFESYREDGVPVFEPNLKAGGHWYAKLVIPERIRESGEKVNTKRNIDGSPKTVKWIIEVASQILFSNTASVNYELLIGRDARSLEIGFAAVAGKGYGEPGQVQDFKQTETLSPGGQSQPRGVYSRAIDLTVEDTATLWDKPALPKWEYDSGGSPTSPTDETRKLRKKTKLHLVILTHGLHGNMGADLIYLKECIDETSRQIQELAKERRQASRRHQRKQSESPGSKSATKQPDSGIHQNHDENEHEEDESDDEQIIVRGFPGNAVRTERGIQYLGKRLAKYVLTMTYPDQPFLPTSKSIARSFTNSFSSASSKVSKPGKPAHSGSSVHLMPPKRNNLPYTFTSISFIGHSLGGLIQTYAIAYIQKHSPEFFDHIKPVNFVALATPFLGLSNENPLYVKFALDFGLVGRTGQDLGLTWRAPNVARTGWSAVMSGFGGNNTTQEQSRQEDPRSKPLLRILPSGPAHQVLKKFRNRTVYSNVVNDGIVPLRTSCLLFLDWRGLGKVENARRENGIIGTMAAFGWAELTGANSTSHPPSTARPDDDEDPLNERQESGRSTRDGETGESQMRDSPLQTTASREAQEPLDHQFLSLEKGRDGHEHNPEIVPNVPRADEDVNDSVWKAYTLPNNPLTDFINLFRPSPGKFQSSGSQKVSNKAAKTYKRAQTIKSDVETRDAAGDVSSEDPSARDPTSETMPGIARGDSYLKEPNSAPPPKTSIFDAAGDILNPPLPPESWLIDPSKRNRTIFHDRIYHPDDIPLPPSKKPKMPRSISSNGSLKTNARSQSVGGVPVDASGMKVEEKIARAYHSGMSWRKVLVRLEPDAHNNMIVRRMFANAYGWDVVKHLCDTHFGDTFAANTRDEFEGREDRAWPLEKSCTEIGNQVDGQSSDRKPRSKSELREEHDQVADLKIASEARGSLTSSIVNPTPRSSRSQDSAMWNDSILDDDENDAEDSDEEATGPFESFQRFWSRSPKPEGRKPADDQPAAHDAKAAVHTQQLQTKKDKQGSSQAQISEYLTQSPVETQLHRGLGVFKPDPAIKSTFEANAIEPLGADPVKPSELLDRSIGIQSTSEVGLKKPPEAHISASSAPSMSKEED